MARGITEAQVHAAADALVAAGERPTVERIRAHLGSGSPNTVTRLLDTWWAALGARLAALAPRIALPEAPEAIQRLAGEWWAQAVAAARDQAEAALGGEREALTQAQAALADAHAEGVIAIAAATQAREAADQARILAEARLVEAQRRADHLEAQLADVTEQRAGLVARTERLEHERDGLADRLQTERAAAAQEREAQTSHIRAVEDRAHAEVDRTRQEAQELRAQLRAIARERGQERDALETALKQTKSDLAVAERELAKQIGRAEALEAHLAQQAARTLQMAGAAPKPRKVIRQPRRVKGKKDSGG